MATSPLSLIFQQKSSEVYRLDSGDFDALEQTPLAIKPIASDELIVRHGDQLQQCKILVDGLAYRSKTSPSGCCQILSILVPGDFLDLQSLHVDQMDHDVVALSDCLVGFVPHRDLRMLMEQRPNIASALWREITVEGAIFREWIFNIGQRQGASRMAHLILELFARLSTIGRTRAYAFELPLTQQQFADALGLTAVHVNRIFKGLRTQGLIEATKYRITILDEIRLRQLAEFDSVYLHPKIRPSTQHSRSVGQVL